MKIVKNISVPLLLAVFTLSSTGFILQKYFCHTCDFEHKDLVILDIKENSHKHHECNICLIETESCSCTASDDMENKETDYFSIENLFFSEKKHEIKPLIIEVLTQNFIYNNLTISIISDKIINYSGLSPPFKKKLNKHTLNILFSVFIL